MAAATKRAPAKAKTDGEPAADGSTIIDIRRIDLGTMIVPIRGTSSLIAHRFSEKAKLTMLNIMQGRKSPREAKNPDAEYEGARYRFEDGGDGFPIIAFKAATVGGARFYSSVTMTALRQFMFFSAPGSIDGQPCARIEGEPKMREDVVRVMRGGTDLRYRPEFADWRTELTISWVRSALTQDSVLSLVDAGGLGVGVGEWRPEKGGDFGRYEVDPEREIRVLG